MKDYYEKLVEEYSLMLLNWAYRKLGNRQQAEELVQEVWLQVFSAVERNALNGVSIQKEENFIWRIAHYVWCGYLRNRTSYGTHVLVDDIEVSDQSDFAQDLADEEERQCRISIMRKKVMSLNYLQREIMISFYLDKKSQREIAKQFGISEASVKWYLFETRKQLKEEIMTGKENNFVYRPRKLHMAINGQAAPALDTKHIENNLVMQNLCIACYRQPRTLDELVEILGIPKVYLENDLQWLVEKEFMLETKNGYSTAFMITSKEEKQEEYKIYLQHKESLVDVMIEGLMAAEDTIREIGFVGAKKPMDQLLWMLIYQFCQHLDSDYFLETSATFRPDGGKYHPLGYDLTEPEPDKIVMNTKGWAQVGPMANNHYEWFGLYHFGDSEIMDFIDQFTTENRQMQEVLNQLIYSDFLIADFKEDQRYILSKLVQKGYITIEEASGKSNVENGAIDKAHPNFCIFTNAQYRQLEEKVFMPLIQKLQSELNSLRQDLEAFCKKMMPKQLKKLYPLFLKMAYYDISFVMIYLAFQEGKLYVPKDKRDGEFLTFVYIE